MFGGDMQQMMKQMGMDVDQLDADKVEIHIGDQKLVFNNPQVSKINAQGKEIFNLQGNYNKEKTDQVSEEDIELVMQKTECTKEEAKEALQNTDDVAEAVMQLQ
jgi:nascent polypeptide-associated complex subunit alpha